MTVFARRNADMDDDMDEMKTRYVQVHNVTSLAARKNMGTSNGVIDSVLLEAGQPGGDIVGENVVYLELGVDWTSLRSKVGNREKSAQGRRRVGQLGAGRGDSVDWVP